MVSDVRQTWPTYIIVFTRLASFIHDLPQIHLGVALVLSAQTFR